MGPAVGGHGDVWVENATKTSSNVVIQNNVIENLTCWTREVPAAVLNGAVQNDVRGAVLQFIDTVEQTGICVNHQDGTYKRNPLADMQIMVAHAVQRGIFNHTGVPGHLQIATNTIGSDIIDWAMSPTAVLVPPFRCNGDSMHHVKRES